MTDSVAFDGCEPCGDTVLAVESGVDAVGFEGADCPAGGGVEGGAQLGFRDGVRAGVRTGFRAGIAEAKQVKGCTWFGHRCKTGNVSGSLGGVEGVEESAVDDGIECTAEAVELERIGEDEFSRKAAIVSFFAGADERGFSDVNTEDGSSEGGDVERVVAAAAACVEHCAGDGAAGGQTKDSGLGMAYLPRRRAVLVGGIPALPAHAFVAGGCAAGEGIGGGR